MAPQPCFPLCDNVPFILFCFKDVQVLYSNAPKQKHTKKNNNRKAHYFSYKEKALSLLQGTVTDKHKYEARGFEHM